MSQRDLEHSSGIPKSRISRYENGHLLPSLMGLRRLSESLGVSGGLLLGETETPFRVFVRELEEHGVTFASEQEAEEAATLVVTVLLEGGRRGAHRPA